MCCVILQGAPASAAAEESARPARSGPTIRFIYPLQGQVVGGLFRVVLEAQHDTSVSQVSLFREEQVIGIDVEPPFEFLWDTRAAAEGSHTLLAKALDPDFREGQASAYVTVDNTPPTVSLTVPKPGATAVGVVHLTAVADDRVGVKLVRFLINGQAFGEVSGAPYMLPWDTNQVPNTRYTVEARAFDVAGNGATSEPAHVRVSNFNREPVFPPITPPVLPEGLPWTWSVEARDPDAPRDSLTYQIEGLPAWATADPATGTLQGTPPTSEATVKKPSKTYPLHITVCDPEPLCATAHTTLTVTDRDSLPVIEPIPDQRVAEGQAMAFQITAADPDGDPVTCRSKRLPRWASVHSSKCQVTGTPGQDVASQEEATVVYDQVEFLACNADKLCGSQAISIAVVNVNRGPVWDALEPLTAKEGERLLAEVTAVDLDQDTVTLSAASLPDGAQFANLGGGIGRLTWTPRVDQGGLHEAALSVTDGLNSATALIPITVEDRVMALTGTVVDADEKPVPDIAVRLLSGASAVKEADTDATGLYLFTNIQPGSYVIKPSYEPERGFSTSARAQTTAIFEPRSRRVEVSRGDQRGLDFVMVVQ